MDTRSEHLACRDSGLSQIFKLIVCSRQELVSTINGLASVALKDLVLKLPIDVCAKYHAPHYAAVLNMYEFLHTICSFLQLPGRNSSFASTAW